MIKIYNGFNYVKQKIGVFNPGDKNFKIILLKSLKVEVEETFNSLADNDSKLLFIQTTIISLYNYHAEQNNQMKINQYNNSCDPIMGWCKKLSYCSYDNIPDLKRICPVHAKSKIINSISNKTLLIVPLCEEAKDLEEFLLSLIPNKHDNIVINIKFINYANTIIHNLQKEVSYKGHQEFIELLIQVRQYFCLPLIIKENITYFLDKLKKYKTNLDSMDSYLTKIQNSLFGKDSFLYFKYAEAGLLEDMKSISSINSKLTELISIFTNCLHSFNVQIEESDNDVGTFAFDNAHKEA